MLIMQDALPLFKSFLKPVSLKPRARQLVLRCVIAFLMHLGKMSASRVAGTVGTDARRRGSSQSILGTPLLAAMRSARPIACPTARNGSTEQGTFIFDIDQTYCSQQGKLTENTIIRGEKTKHKSKKKQKKYTQRSSHCFVMGLLITPSGMRLPFSVSYYTEAYCKAKKIAAPQADRTGRSTYPPVAFAPQKTHAGGPGRHRLRRRGHPHCLQGTQV